MKRLNKASMVQLVMLDSGDLITRYELKQVQSAKKRAERRLVSELAGLEAQDTYMWLLWVLVVACGI